MTRKSEEMRQKELRGSPGGNSRDSFQRSQTGDLAGMASGMGWKGFGLLILLLIVGFVIVRLFFS